MTFVKKFIRNYFKWIALGSLLGLVVGTLLSWQLLLGKNNYSLKSKTQANQSLIEIPKLKVKAPIIGGVDPSKESEYNKALTKGVILMPGPGVIGKSGNVVIYGHSSAKEKSPYQKVFATLNNLKNNDKIKVYKNRKEYIYRIIEKKIIEPTDFSVLENTKDETLTLITCWPLNTDEKRLIIVAKR